MKNIGSPSGVAGSSGRNFRGTTLGTWMKDQWPASRVFSVAGKDRAAIMMAGPKTNGVYWFEDGIGFTTSTAYTTDLPSWLKEFNANLLRRLESQTMVWTAVGPENGAVLPGEWKADLTGQPIVSRLPRVIQTQGFPLSSRGGYLLHETQDGSFWRRFGSSPFWDEAILNAAKTLVEKEHLGQGEDPDLLCLGLSSTNAIEHAFGNAGPEIQDDVRRLDINLGDFLETLDRQGIYAVVVFSADHGGLDFAERLRSQGIPARRVDTQAWLHELQGRLKAEFQTSDNLVSGGDQQLYIDRKAAAKLGDAKEVTAKIEKVVKSMPEVAAAATREELEALPSKRFSDPCDAIVLYRLKFSAPPGRSADILFAFNPLVERDGPPLHDPAQHGTPWDYDRRVPLIFWGNWKAEHTEKPASTVDIAPTLAKELGIKPEEELDGVPLPLTSK